MTVLTACATPLAHFETLAKGGNLDRVAVHGGAFAHLIYRNEGASTPGAEPLLIVFLEGDGLPWAQGGRRPSPDPMPRRPLALELLLATDVPALYLTRPCYNGLMVGTCAPAAWTSARYSSTVVESLEQALRIYLAANPAGRLLLVGYSGGGTLATLLATRLDKVAAVVTIAANLDTERWAAFHGYLPLHESLNPAATDGSGTREIHLTGARDANVPEQTLSRYKATHPGADWWRLEEFDHVCCWVEEWPLLLDRILMRIDGT